MKCGMLISRREPRLRAGADEHEIRRPLSSSGTKTISDSPPTQRRSTTGEITEAREARVRIVRQPAGCRGSAMTRRSHAERLGIDIEQAAVRKARAQPHKAREPPVARRLLCDVCSSSGALVRDSALRPT